MVGERVTGAATGRARPPSTTTPSSVGRTARWRSSRAATSSPSGPAASTASRSCDRGAASASGDTTQPPGVGSPALAGEPLEVVGGDPAPLGDDPVDRAVGRARAAGQHRGHVEDLAAADRLGPPALPQHVAVAGQQGHGAGEVQAHEALVARRDGVGRRATRSRTGCSPEPMYGR